MPFRSKGAAALTERLDVRVSPDEKERLRALAARAGLPVAEMVRLRALGRPVVPRTLLFPSDTGGFRSRSVLDQPFRDVAAAIKLGKHVTPRGMRRTYQDLARAAEMKDLVTRAISGHATEQMQQHYSTVAQTEMREGIAKIISLAGVREAMEAGGMEVVCIAPNNENGQVGIPSQLADSA